MRKAIIKDNQREKPKKQKSILKKDLFASEFCYRRLSESAKDGILIPDAKTGKIVDVKPFLMDLLTARKEVEAVPVKTGKELAESIFLVRKKANAV